VSILFLDHRQEFFRRGKRGKGNPGLWALSVQRESCRQMGEKVQKPGSTPQRGKKGRGGDKGARKKGSCLVLSEKKEEVLGKKGGGG